MRNVVDVAERIGVHFGSRSGAAARRRTAACGRHSGGGTTTARRRRGDAADQATGCLALRRRHRKRVCARVLGVDADPRAVVDAMARDVPLFEQGVGTCPPSGPRPWDGPSLCGPWAPGPAAWARGWRRLPPSLLVSLARRAAQERGERISLRRGRTCMRWWRTRWSRRWRQPYCPPKVCNEMFT